MTPTTVDKPLTIRDATLVDAEAICRIYNQGIEDRVATLETETRTPAERREWLAARTPRHPVLIAETEPPIISNSPSAARTEHATLATTGWASLNRFNPRPVYDHVADLSVYVDRAWRGHGIGRALLGSLIERARAIGYHKIVLAAFPDNAAGMALYGSVGFSRVGVYREQGWLDGRWVDVVVMERLL